MDKLNILNEAKKAKTIDELKQMAIDNGITLTDEEAEFYFSLVNETKDELSPEDLDAATGGVYNGNDKTGTGKSSHCSNWRCKRCGSAVKSLVYNFCGCKRHANGLVPINDCHNCVQWMPNNSTNSCPHYLYNGTTDGC